MKAIFTSVVKRVILLIVFSAILNMLSGQQGNKFTIKGQLTDQKSMQPVPFATVALRRSSDAVLITGVASDLDGQYIIGPVNEDNYRMEISAIGYLPESRDIRLVNDYEAGTICLQEKSVQLNEIVISSERKKAEAGMDKITYFINTKMVDASNSGADLISFIPGVQVDLMKNISLGGSQNVIILVDGKERERNFLSQLDPATIDKVEVSNVPDSRYDAGVTGVINIILKKDRESGINGHIYAEAPVSSSEIYLSPSYSFNYGFRKLNLYTSYNGELIYFDLLEKSKRTVDDVNGTTEFFSEQDVRQKYWSHRFHYGFDYLLNDKNQINFYAYYNPYSRELDGTTLLKVSGENIEDEVSRGTKEDTDINSSAFYSLYYKHSFDKPGNQIEIDLSNYNFKAENSTTFGYDTGDQIINTVMPLQNISILKIDFTSPVTEKLKLATGIKTRLQSIHNQQEPFRYNEDIFAAYTSVTYKLSKLTISTGIRAEKSFSELESSFSNNVFALLPDAAINYKLTARQTMKLFYNRTVDRPGLYELNPYTFYEDPYAIRSGNPYLEAEFRQNLSFTFSNSFGNNFISMELYYRNRTDAINNYSFVNDTSVFETRTDNLGDIHAYGIQAAGAFKVLNFISVNPYLNLFYLTSEGNSLARQYKIPDRHKIAFQSGISAIASFRHDFTASFNFQYNSPNMQIQEISFSDPLYIISLEKGFLNKYKFGIKTALPLSRSFTYRGTETSGDNFFSHSEGNLKLSGFPVWFNFRFQFNSGKKINKIDREKESIDTRLKKGF